MTKLTQFTPYRKAVVSAIGSLVFVVFQVVTGDGPVAPDALAAALIGLLTTLGVFGVSNDQNQVPSPVQPSQHTMSELVARPAKKKTATRKKSK